MKLRADRTRELLHLLTSEHVRFGVSVAPSVSGVIEVPGEQAIRAHGLTIALAIRESWLPSRDDRPELHAARYTVFDAALGREVFGYHHHPPVPAIAHFHIGAGAGAIIDAVHDAHFPAPGAKLEDIIAMLIRDFRVRPRRRDWEQVLERK